jgi:hypothetical protein
MLWRTGQPGNAAWHYRTLLPDSSDKAFPRRKSGEVPDRDYPVLVDELNAGRLECAADHIKGRASRLT